jgi:arylsulfatase A-like enzyme
MTDHVATRGGRWLALQSVLLTALVLGLVAAAIQVAVQMANAVLLERLVFTSRDVLWMAPLSWTAFGLAAAVPFAVLALALPRLPWPSISLGCFVAGVVLLLLVPFEGIATWAAAIVGAGAGVQVVRLAPTRSERWLPLLRRAGLGLVALFALGALGASGWRALGARRAVAGLPPADAGAPNVLLVVLDVVRAANLSAYGYERPTSPTLERIAREGARFERAYAVAPWTLPSHASMFTGLFPTDMRASYRLALEDGPATLAERFRDRGYRTAGFTANQTYTAWDSRINRGFERWSDYRRTWEQVRYSALPWQTAMVRELRSARSLREVWVAVRYFPLRAPTNLAFDQKRGHLVTREFLEWERSLPDQRPFLAFLNFYDAHRPRFAPPEIQRRFTGGRSLQFDRYDGAIAFIDTQLAAILDSLRVRGELDNTVIAVVGDHGELLGEHQFVGHSNMVYRDLLWVPFLLRYPPRIAAGAQVPTPVSLRDLAATLLDLSARSDSAARLAGTSLVPLVTGKAGAAPSPVFSYAHQGSNIPARFPNATGPLFSLVIDSLHYIRHPREELLFNLVRDGAEERNLAADPAFSAVVSAARHVVDSLARLEPGRRRP